MNTNASTADSRDSRNRAALDLANMFYGRVIAKAAIDGGANVLALTDGGTITICHDVKTYDIVDGQTGAKRTPGRVSTRKRVRSSYSESEAIHYVGACKRHHKTRAHPSHYARIRSTQKDVGRVAPGNPRPRAPHAHALDTLSLAR